MIPVGLAVTLLGYSVFYYGVTQIKGGNWGYLDLTLPTRWSSQAAATPRDGETGTAGNSSSTGSTAKSSPSILNTIGKAALGPFFF